LGILFQRFPLYISLSAFSSWYTHVHLCPLSKCQIP
jgi:hypothetical protein